MTENTKTAIIVLGGLAFIVLSALVANYAMAEPREGDCAVQAKLTSRGYNPGPIDCNIGDDTTLAIKAFQFDNGLPPTGRVGPRTHQALFGRHRVTTPSADDYQPVDLKANGAR